MKRPKDVARKYKCSILLPKIWGGGIHFAAIEDDPKLQDDSTAKKGRNNPLTRGRGGRKKKGRGPCGALKLRHLFHLHPFLKLFLKLIQDIQYKLMRVELSDLRKQIRKEINVDLNFVPLFSQKIFDILEDSGPYGP